MEGFSVDAVGRNPRGKALPWTFREDGISKTSSWRRELGVLSAAKFFAVAEAIEADDMRRTVESLSFNGRKSTSQV